jgi:hypothetical protein
MKHIKTNLCFLAIIVAAIGIGMFLRKTRIVEGHGGGGGRGGGHGGGIGRGGGHGGGWSRHGAIGRGRGWGYYGPGTGAGYFPLYYGDYSDYSGYSDYDNYYLTDQPIYPIIQVPNYPYYY